MESVEIVQVERAAEAIRAGVQNQTMSVEKILDEARRLVSLAESLHAQRIQGATMRQYRSRKTTLDKP